MITMSTDARRTLPLPLAGEERGLLRSNGKGEGAFLGLSPHLPTSLRDTGPFFSRKWEKTN
jgi:hypothetical protein